MALSFSFALLGAMFFGLTWLPVASSLFLRPEKEKQFAVTRFIMKIFYRSYDPVIRWTYDHKWVIFSLAAASLVFTGVIFSRMGGEFVPTLDEGDFVIQPVLKTGTSLSKTVELTTRMENILIDSFPEVDQIVCRIGAAEVPTDPMSMEEIDMIIKLHPKDTWVSANSKEELANRFKEALTILPGIDYEFTQPIEMRFNELITGVRADLAIKIFGEDLDILAEKAQEVKSLITDVPGAADVIIEKTAGLPQMSVKYRRNRIAYYGLSIKELNRYLTMAFGGATAGNVFEGEKRFDLVVRLLPEFRQDIEHIRNLPVALSNGKQVPLSELAEISYSTGPAKISRDNTRRRIVVSVNVRNRDLESVVNDIESILNQELQLPAGYTVDYGGQFENLRNASKRLKIAVPIALLLIFIFLHFAFSSFKEAALIFTAVPLSIVGGVFLLWIRGMPFSISAGIGFIALFGVAVLNGIVLIEHLKDLKKQGITDMRERILKGTTERLRPVLLTAGAAALGFLPMAISTSAGAEVQRPLATVVIGGLVTSTLLTMLALPLLYAVVDEITGIQLWPPRFKRGRILPLLLLLLIPALAHSQSPGSTRIETKVLSLPEMLETAYRNNSELEAYRFMAEESNALIKSAFSIDKTSLYYSYDENNIASNDYPIGVFGGEQRFDFPTVYFAQKEANTISYNMAMNQLERKKIEISRKVSKAYYNLQYQKNRQRLYEKVDSIYTRFSVASEASYQQGAITYLEMLNARARHQEVFLVQSQVQHDMDIAQERLSTLIQFDSAFTIPNEALQVLVVVLDSVVTDPGLHYLQNAGLRQNAELKVEKNLLLPEFTLGYFNGTNRYEGAENYQGFEVGVGVPLFFGEQRARVKAKQFAMEATASLQASYIRNYENRVSELMNGLAKYKDAILYYDRSGKALAAELIRSAQKSYSVGEIDFFRLAQSLDRALEIELGYLDNVHWYNELVLEINYLTLEN
jgi:heavy metal efflux system protein